MFPVYPRLWADPQYRDDAEALLATCIERDVGVMAIKAVARRPWADGRPLAPPSTATRPPTPVGDVVVRAVADDDDRPGHRVRPVDARCARLLHARRLGLLPRVLAAAEAWVPMDETAEAAAAAEWPPSHGSRSEVTHLPDRPGLSAG